MRPLMGLTPIGLVYLSKGYVNVHPRGILREDFRQWSEVCFYRQRPKIANTHQKLGNGPGTGPS
jgi:hypothetical protein